jgi:hypothetical protein
LSVYEKTNDFCLAERLKTLTPLEAPVDVPRGSADRPIELAAQRLKRNAESSDVANSDQNRCGPLAVAVLPITLCLEQL